MAAKGSTGEAEPVHAIAAGRLSFAGAAAAVLSAGERQGGRGDPLFLAGASLALLDALVPRDPLRPRRRSLKGVRT
jgi:hypothetical protein